ncbi:bone morphogenetic protein 7-like [Pollicipes pollicipes]|uniref:bone morphogenetic protein 7-like n=1 Tax=Pollicipes pollicipes TaxID=41117 RepID=UPI001884B24D|nr:bone morphogenetic protein 7-like [Pollicipes pollicipes]
MWLLWACVACGVAAAAAEHSPIYVDNGSGQTVAGEDISKRERAEIQEDLLQLLGLHRRPRPAVQQIGSSAPQFLMDIYNSMVDDEDTGDLKLNPDGAGDAWRDFNITNTDKEVIDESDVIMSFTNHGSKSFQEVDYARSQLLWFDLTEVPLDENRLVTTLRVYQGYTETSAFDFRQSTLHVHQLMRGENHTIHLKEVDRRPLEPGYVGWLTFNVTRAADLWRVFPDFNLGLYIEVMLEDGSTVVPAQAGIVDAFGEEARQPFMTAFFKQPAHDGMPPPSRFRRAPGGRRRKDRKRNRSSEPYSPLKELTERREYRVCQKQNLYVSFRDLGWQDWIIAPDGYAAFFCTGLCAFPLNSQMNATNHAIVQTLTHLLEPYTYPKPSCAPTKLNSISVLYFNDNLNVILKKYRKMVASSCGCH